MDTRRLTGHPVSQDDLAFLVRIWNDERVAPTVGGVRTMEELSGRVAEWSRHWSDHGFGTTVFAERTTGEPVGWGGLQHSRIGIGECLTVGYVIRPDRWGRGFATEIAATSVDHAFDVLASTELYASVAATNAASRRVLEKAGLSVHRELDHDGQVEVIYIVRR